MEAIVETVIVYINSDIIVGVIMALQEVTFHTIKKYIKIDVLKFKNKAKR